MPVVGSVSDSVLSPRHSSMSPATSQASSQDYGMLQNVGHSEVECDAPTHIQTKQAYSERSAAAPERVPLSIAFRRP